MQDSFRSDLLIFYDNWRCMVNIHLVFEYYLLICSKLVPTLEILCKT